MLPVETYREIAGVELLVTAVFLDRLSEGPG
jgi:hypothetical protein